MSEPTPVAVAVKMTLRPVVDGLRLEVNPTLDACTICSLTAGDVDVAWLVSPE